MSSMEELINDSLNEEKVDKVNDSNPGELEKEENETFVISSIEDLLFFAYDVRNGNTYEGKTVKLGTSLDFNSSKSYVDAFRTDYGKYGYDGELKTLLTSGEGFLPIGTTSNIDTVPYSFKGTFDGGEKTLYNFYMNSEQSENEEKRIGLFGNNYGVIKNLSIKMGNINLRMKNLTCDVGGIAAKNYNQIINCNYTGKSNLIVDSTSSGQARIGGIASGNGGKVTNCYHNGEINVDNQSSNIQYLFVGGISSGVNGTEASTNNSFSKGKIEVITEDVLSYVGGISGSNWKTIENSYNTKEIKVEKKTTNDKRIFQGGIAGQDSSNGSITNCYNVGEMKSDKNDEKKFIGGLLGYSENDMITNCYYLQGMAIKGVANQSDDNNQRGKTREEMLESEFVELLNNNTDVWMSDTEKVNNGYPILKKFED